MPSSIYRSRAAHVRVRDWCEAALATWPVPHSRRQVETSAGPTNVVRTEPGTEVGAGRATIVLIPGTNMNAAVSLGFAQALSRVAPLIVLDVPGQPGLSSGERPRRHRMDWYGRWLTETLTRVTPDPAVVVGHSLGGAIALASGSGLIAGRVLVSTAGLVRLRVDASALGATVPWLLRPSVPRAERLLRHMSSPGAPVPDELSRWMAPVGSSCHTSLAPAPLSSAALAPARSVPSLVVAGSHDPFLPPASLGPAAEQRLGTVLRVLDGCGHLLPEESPVRLAALVAEFTDACGRH
ncbi:alpha/beta fold hydrolase [Streptomyces gardneri]|uniref:alpha/beta fold hydrolase n=1 Tax=Streptomyces gardneri TaxID=66892 RepID=UPI0033CD36CF